MSGGYVAEFTAAALKDIAFAKEEIMRRRRYKKYREVLRFLLEEGAVYSFRVVDRLLMEYLKKKGGLNG